MKLQFDPNQQFQIDAINAVADIFDGQQRGTSEFSVEMETGTGKTYVYLRTIFELSQRYSFQKFVVVVPSVAIRKGVLKNIEITKEHFRALYNNLLFEHFVYDSKRFSRLRQFGTSNTLQIMVINIDAFRADSEHPKRTPFIAAKEPALCRQVVELLKHQRREPAGA